MRNSGLTVALLFTAASQILAQAWINEFHYDNAGSDVGEFVEVFVADSYSGPLTELQLELYNGNGGTSYGSFTVDPDFSEGDTIPGVGTFYTIMPSSIQNGAPDGIALSNGSGLIEFISYEGTFTAVGGSADGGTSVDIGVSQPVDNPVGSSLGLTGTGEIAANFSWSVIATGTPGSINSDQSFDTFVSPPEAADAAATGAETIELSFTTNAASNDVLIVRNLSGSFNDPAGTAPASGDSFAGGIVVSRGSTTPVTDAGLTPDTEVFYAFYSVDASDNYSSPLVASATPDRIILNEEDFSGTPAWRSESVSGTDAGWDVTDGNASISGFGESPDENHYLVSPALDFSTSADLAFSFIYSERFTGPDPVILYSTDYTGSGNPEANGSWTEIPFVFDDLSDSSTYAGPTSGSVNLPKTLEGVSTTYLAFKYTADGTGAGSETWIVDDLEITRSTAAIVIDPEPTNQATAFSANPDGNDTINLSWTDATGDDLPAGYLILANQTGTFADPADGTPVTIDSDLSDGEAAITVPQGTESASFSNLPGGTGFFFKLFAYSNAGINIDYKTEAAPAESTTTLNTDPEPPNHASAFSVTVDGQLLTLDWTDASAATGYLLLANTSGNFTSPVDGVDPTMDTDLSDGSALVKIDQGVQTADLTGLPDTEYFFTLYVYSNDGINIDFKTDGTAPSASGTTEPLPQLIISEIMQNPELVSDSLGEYIEIYNAGSSPVDLQSYTLKDDDSDSHLIASSVIVPAQGYAVLARDGDDTANGGFVADYVYSGFSLSNGGDEVVLVAADGTTEVDRITYDGGPSWPDPAGAAMVFTGTASDDNNDPTFWTTATVREPGFIGSDGPDVDKGSPGFTGSDQNLPSLTDPFGLSVLSDSPTSTSINFTAVGGNDVVVLFNSTGSFGTPSGTPPAPGTSLADGTVLSVGQTSPVTHNGLTTGEEVFYAVYSVNDSGIYSPGLTASATPGLINEENFESNSVWVNRSVEGDDPWDTSGGTANIDGATSNGTGSDTHYLVSPEFNLTGKADVTIRFDYGNAYVGPDIQLAYSTNYSGTGNPEDLGITWTIIPTTLIDNDGTDSTPVNDSGLIALPGGLEGESSVYLAFIYTADGTLDNSEAWQIDHIQIAYSSQLDTTDPLGDYLIDRGITAADLATDTNGNGFPAIIEYLAGFGDGEGRETIRFAADPANFALTLNSDRATDPDGIIVELLATSDLANGFAPVAHTVTSIDEDDGTHTRSYTEDAPPAEAETRFYQLRVTEAP
ncbi:MAG: lamin tail domain-containing protein [Opitutales bacterium]